MFAEKALELLKELNRNPDNLPPFNDDLVRQVLEEMRVLYNENHQDVTNSESDQFAATVKIRHLAIKRNKRILLSYYFNRMQRIRAMRWQFGSILPPDVKENLSVSEQVWFNNYSKSLAKYMRSVGDEEGLDLMQDMKPPKSLYMEVRCLIDYGKIELDDGTSVLLKKNTQHLLPRAQCETLIRQGVLEHIL
ncbi:DNA replication complex GINS protein PSF1-like [Chrysoperla carnea]|uniref:DNA replication complex GINS protein PSF1-like n=1 Tax=Chrysoperla carnea TaxID=189513 RepID=UPI001D085C77|nr:DNA replication complex GINS protein PSF1-like [Chrysoperla carnea]